MSSAAEPRFLIVETSGRTGQVAVARGATLLRSRRLEEARRHARDLAPAIGDLLAAESWKPTDLHGLIVSRGPGSYTGLRVGLMSAKALAYVTGCTLLAVDTFAAIARQVPEDVARVDVLADAQQDKIYLQSFARPVPGGDFLPVSALAIRPFMEWLASREASAWVTGPGLRPFQNRLPAGTRVIDAAHWDPRPESLLAIGLDRFQKGEQDDLWTLEPLYLRPSSAEEKWTAGTGSNP